MIYFRRHVYPPFYRATEYRQGQAPIRILEISSRSSVAEGRALSAMSLLVQGSDGRARTLESVYQAAKDYGLGPETRIEALNGFDAKRDSRRRAEGAAHEGRRLMGFRHQGLHWPAESGTAFYDHLWMTGALNRYGSRLKDLLNEYDGYSDCFFRPGAMRACQAAAAAAMSQLLTARERRPDPALDRALEDPAGWAEWRNVRIGTKKPKSRKTTVGNRRTIHAQTNDVYIGRPSRWGNPFPLKNDADRGEAVEKYRAWLTSQVRNGSITTAELATLSGRRLVCWCAPKGCHGEVLAAAADWAAAGAKLKETRWMRARISASGHLQMQGDETEKPPMIESETEAVTPARRNVMTAPPRTPMARPPANAMDEARAVALAARGG